MAITYLSGERIQGSSTAGAEARKYTIATDYSTTVSATNLASDNSDWVTNDSTNSEVSSDRLNFQMDSSEDVVYYDLQNANALNGSNASDTAWTLRWTYNGTSKGTDCFGYIGLSSTTTNAGENQDQIALYIKHVSSSSEKKYGCHDVEGSDPDSTSMGNANGWDPSSGYTYYFELTRTSATAYAIRKYTDSDYDTLDQGEITGSCAATLNNLRYIKLSVDASTDSTMEYKFDDVKFWNGITSATTTEPADANIAGTDEKTSITNVPAGTRYEETDTRKIFHRTGGSAADWVEMGSSFADRFRGLWGGGYGASSLVNTIDFIIIATTGNAADFGNLTRSNSGMAGCADATRGCWGGGDNTIDYITVATLGDATDFGNLQASKIELGACSDATRGVWAGGSTGSKTNEMGYITIQTTGNAADFGNLTSARSGNTGTSNGTLGIFGGGNTGSLVNTIDYITIQSAGNATDFGDLSGTRAMLGACSDTTRGVFGGGENSVDIIEYVTYASAGNATDFGDLTSGQEQLAGCADATRGCFGGGRISSTNTNVIEYITIQTTGDATDFGDLTEARRGIASGVAA